MEKIGIKISEARIRVTTDLPELAKPEKFYWLDTNFLEAEIIPLSSDMDAELIIRENDSEFSFKAAGNRLELAGDFSRWEREAEDKRYSIFGNLGVFSAWALRTLETAHSIFTLHACGLVKGRKLLIIPGGAGAGKSVFLFSALRAGWKIFSTEFVHLRISSSLDFFKGSLKDAVRVDTLKVHFPDLAAEFGSQLQAETGGKLLVDLSPYQVKDYQLSDPDVFLVFPHVENDWEGLEYQEITGYEVLLRKLFASASEKIEKSILLYGCRAVPGLDTLQAAQKRKMNLEKFLQNGAIKKCWGWVSSVRDTRELFNILG